MSNQEILLETGTNELEIIEFFIHEQQGEEMVTHYFGVNVAKVLEVVEAPPGLDHQESATHPSFLGTIPLRDLVLPVIDLSVWLNMERTQTDNEPIVVTEFNNAVTGFLVSGVTQIHRVSWKDVHPPGKYVSSLGTNCITGTVQLKDRFTLMLDLEMVLSDLDERTGGDSELDEMKADERIHALVADDSTSVRQLLENNFGGANFEVTLAADGAEAWRMLEALKAKAQEEGRKITDFLDVVVSDVEMPQMDGYTLTRRIKDDPILKDLPVCLFSSIISKGILHKGEAVKADAQVTKPEFTGLVQRVIDLVEEWRAK